MFSESNRAIDCNRTVALVAAPLLPLHLTGVASDFEFVLFYLVVPAVVLAIAIYFRDQFGAGPKEMTYRIHWDSAFFGMGVAFMVAAPCAFCQAGAAPLWRPSAF